jgi:acyl dehydratase
VALGAETPRRYAEVSGDWSAHHFDAGAAARSGAPAPFLHGLCTLAACTHAVLGLAGADPGRVRRVAARFSAPAVVGVPLAVDTFAADGGLAFEAVCGEAVVIRNGRLELA